jgi:hypothetical protein
MRPIVLLAALALTGCTDQFVKNLTGQSGVDRVPPTTTAFYTAPAAEPAAADIVIPVSEPVVEAVVPVNEPEPIAEIPAPPPEPACVPKFREPCPGDA